MDQDSKIQSAYFYFISKSGKVFITWQSRQIKILSGMKASRFIDKINLADSQTVQLILAKVTGNFKRGNE